MRILLVEDERQLSDVLAALLKQQGGYSVDAVYDGVSGEDCALSGIYDAIILDVMLPKKDGMSVLRTLRTEGCSTPVLLLTAKSEVDDKITGLDCGADDYLTKPFATGELLARLRALTRRKGELTGDELTIGQTVLNRRTHELICAENAVKLGLKEYQLMEILLENQKQILSKDRLIEKIWGYDSEAEYNAIEVYISFLRKKLAAIGSPVQIKASRGIGYYLEDGA
ncbi:MAG: response regulator transcription factor [Oscillospiraceae bacterium]|nr:response regulator transcription factor [Oscillospiraceae bacterium]